MRNRLGGGGGGDDDDESGGSERWSVCERLNLVGSELEPAGCQVTTLRLPLARMQLALYALGAWRKQRHWRRRRQLICGPQYDTGPASLLSRLRCTGG